MSEATAAAPAIFLDTLMPCLGQHCLNPRALRLLEHDEEFRALSLRCHQIYYVHDVATSKLQIPISLSSLRRAFQCHRTCVTQALVQGLELPQARGRHLAIDDQIERELLAWIQSNAAKNTVVAAQMSVHALPTTIASQLPVAGSIHSSGAIWTGYAK
jgi:hypothetical protein